MKDNKKYYTFDGLTGKIWVGEESDDAQTQEIPSESKYVSLDNRPVSHSFAYTKDAKVFFFVPDYQFEGILSEFVTSLGVTVFHPNILEAFSLAVDKWQNGSSGV